MGKRSSSGVRAIGHQISSPMRHRNFVLRLRKREERVEDQPQAAEVDVSVAQRPEREEIVPKGFPTRQESFQDADIVVAFIKALIRAG